MTKQGNHKPKANTTFKNRKRKGLQQRINRTHPPKGKERRKEKHRLNGKTRLQMAIKRHLSMTT